MSENIPESAATVEAPLTEALEPKLPFWRQPAVENILPFATSLLLHAGIILIGFLTYKTIETVSSVVRDQIIIPDATLVEGAEVGGVPNPGLGTDPNIVSDVKVEVQEQSKAAESASISVGAIGGDTATEGVIGIGSGTAKLRAGGFGNGNGDGSGSPFGVPGGSGGMGPRSPFMGVSGNAYRIVYICDASGSMLQRRHVVIQALNESVDKLKPVQFFNVFFYHNGDFESLDKNQLIAATPANKTKAYDFAREMEARDSTDPTRAIRSAMAMKPQLVYFLTDGFDERVDDFSKKLRTEFRNLNQSKEVHVNVIYIADTARFKEIGGQMNTAKRDEILTELRAIAEEDNGGRFKVVEAE
jgi:hypothetical protein